MGQAWYAPKPFSPIPMPKRTGEGSEVEDEEDDDDDDEKAILKSVEYICTLIDKENQETNIPPHRIVVGGFSQGCAISLLLGLTSRYAGKLGGVVGLSGYLPLAKTVETAVQRRGKREEDEGMKWLLAHGSRDQLVPVRLFRAYREKLEGW